LALIGLRPEDFDGAAYEVWADGWASVMAFDALGTQWRTGMAGATGLDYAAVPAVLRLTGVPRPQWAQVFADLREMEDEALTVMREHKRG
jgi:hypothetical protein